MKLPEKEAVKPKRKKNWICGIGFMDIEDYVSQKFEIVDGKRKLVWICPFYRTWKSMIVRCYDVNFHSRHTYKDCSVCEEWLYFSNFKRWMETQDYEGKHLDKDLLIEGNKIYSPETCIFVHSNVNGFVLDCRAARGKYMVGVSWHKRDCVFRANCQNPFTRKYEHLGYFTNELEAHLAWKTRKHELACMLADSAYVTDERLANVLRNKYK